jgi:hypothetical protein
MKFYLIDQYNNVRVFYSKTCAYAYRKLWGGVVLREDKYESPQRDEIIQSRRERELRKKEFSRQVRLRNEEIIRTFRAAARKEFCENFLNPNFKRPFRDTCASMIADAVALGEWKIEDWPADRDYDCAVYRGLQRWRWKNPNKQYPNTTLQKIIQHDLVYRDQVAWAQENNILEPLRRYESENPAVFPKRSWLGSRGHFPFT